MKVMSKEYWDWSDWEYGFVKWGIGNKVISNK